MLLNLSRTLLVIPSRLTPCYLVSRQSVVCCCKSVAQLCTCEATLARNLGALHFDDVMSYNSLTSKGSSYLNGVLTLKRFVLNFFQRGKCGVFPSNFVELLRTSMAQSTTSTTTTITSPSIPDAAKDENTIITVADKNKKNEKLKGKS